MVVGSALPNFISVILKQHPNGKTSLVNYPLLEVIIPCSLLGSTLGAITEEFLPKAAQLSLLVVVFSYFTFNFWAKFKKAPTKQVQD